MPSLDYLTQICGHFIRVGRQRRPRSARTCLGALLATTLQPCIIIVPSASLETYDRL